MTLNKITLPMTGFELQISSSKSVSLASWTTAHFFVKSELVLKLFCFVLPLAQRDVGDWETSLRAGKKCSLGLSNEIRIMERSFNCYWLTVANTIPMLALDCVSSQKGGEETLLAVQQPSNTWSFCEFLPPPVKSYYEILPNTKQFLISLRCTCQCDLA